MTSGGLLIGLLIAGLAPDEDAESVIRQHEANFAAIKSIRGTIEGRRSEDGGRTWGPMYSIRFARDGQRERVRSKYYGRYFEDRWRAGVHHIDAAYAPAETRTLTGIDPDDPRPPILAPGSGPSTARGEISAPMPASAEGRRVEWPAFLMINPNVRRSLRELRSMSGKQGFRRGPDGPGGPTWIFDLDSADAPWSYQITVAADRGYSISELAVTSEATTATRSVVEYLTDASGVTLPKLIRSRDDAKGDPVFEVALKDVEVNRPIAGHELTLEFPAGEIVVDRVAEKYHIWGDRGPATTFDTAEDFNEWDRKRRVAPGPPGR